MTGVWCLRAVPHARARSAPGIARRPWARVRAHDEVVRSPRRLGAGSGSRRAGVRRRPRRSAAAANLVAPAASTVAFEAPLAALRFVLGSSRSAATHRILRPRAASTSGTSRCDRTYDGDHLESPAVEPFTVSSTISKPREEVFEYLADIANHPEFTDHYLVDWRLTRENS